MEKTVLECAVAKKTHGAAVVVNFYHLSNRNSLVYMLKRSEKMNLTIVILERELYSQLQPMWMPRSKKRNQTADLLLVHKEEEAQYSKEA